MKRPLVAAATHGRATLAASTRPRWAGRGLVQSSAHGAREVVRCHSWWRQAEDTRRVSPPQANSRTELNSLGSGEAPARRRSGTSERASHRASWPPQRPLQTDHVAVPSGFRIGRRRPWLRLRRERGRRRRVRPSHSRAAAVCRFQVSPLPQALSQALPQAP